VHPALPPALPCRIVCVLYVFITGQKKTEKKRNASSS
jgi:hypothetical protein